MRAAFDALAPHAAGVVAAALHRDAADEADVLPSRRLRAVFISDIHLGTAGCQAQALLDFLRDLPERYRRHFLHDQPAG